MLDPMRTALIGIAGMILGYIGARLHSLRGALVDAGLRRRFVGLRARVGQVAGVGASLQAAVVLGDAGREQRRWHSRSARRQALYQGRRDCPALFGGGLRTAVQDVSGVALACGDAPGSSRKASPAASIAARRWRRA
jgi:hypothetical protein